MHTFDLHTQDTVRIMTIVLDENGGPLTETPSEAVFRLQIDPNNPASAIEYELTRVTPRRWKHQFTAVEITELAALITVGTEYKAKVITSYSGSSEHGVFPTGQEPEDFLYFTLLPTPTTS